MKMSSVSPRLPLEYGTSADGWLGSVKMPGADGATAPTLNPDSSRSAQYRRHCRRLVTPPLEPSAAFSCLLRLDTNLLGLIRWDSPAPAIAGMRVRRWRFHQRCRSDRGEYLDRS